MFFGFGQFLLIIDYLKSKTTLSYFEAFQILQTHTRPQTTEKVAFLYLPWKLLNSMSSLRRRC